MLRKPIECCTVGSYKCQIYMPIRNRVEGIDFCIADIVAALNAANIETLGSCCGYNKMPGDIILENGREIIIVRNAEERNRIFKMMKKGTKKKGKNQ